MVYTGTMAIHSDNKVAECSYLFTTNSETDIKEENIMRIKYKRMCVQIQAGNFFLTFFLKDL